MKRSSALAVLSREHHVALEIALRLRRATAADAADLRQAALRFWRDEGRDHFRIEEELLLPALARHAGADDADIARVRAEHADIARRVGDLEAEPVPAVPDLNGLGAALRDHVRYEERALFGRIEQSLEPQELTALGAALRSADGEQRPPQD